MSFKLFQTIELKAEARPAVIALARDGARLLGPSCEHDVRRLAAALHAESPWLRDVSAWFMAQMLRHVAAGGHGLWLPPVILAGSPGIGKSHYARTLARLVGVPARMIDVGGGSAGFRISGTEKSWSTEQPGIPVETILATRIANPVIIVDEIDKATTTYGTRGASSSLTTSLLQMLEGTTAAHFECPFYRLPFNMSRVVWIMTANDADLIPAPLRDRTRVFHIPNLSVVDAVAYFDRLTAPALSSLTVIATGQTSARRSLPTKTGPAPLSFRSFESDTRYQGEQTWPLYEQQDGSWTSIWSLPSC